MGGSELSVSTIADLKLKIYNNADMCRDAVSIYGTHNVIITVKSSGQLFHF